MPKRLYLTKPSSASSTAKKKVSPRKDSSKYQAVLQATRELVEENGYRSLSIKSVSSRAKVSRNLIYNWWDGDLSRVVEESLLPDVSEWQVPDTGSLHSDFEAFVDMSIEAMHRPHVLGGYLELSSQAIINQDMLARTTKYFRAPYSRLLGKILRNATQRGEATGNFDHMVLAQILTGSMLQFAISKKPGKRNSKKVLVEMLITLTS